jgi:2-iminobutanoate/2-iminopropanoate deaminase
MFNKNKKGTIMKKKEIRTAKSPLPGGPYSQGLRVGERIYVAGQRPQAPVTGDIPADFAGQARQCLENIRNILEADGSSMNDVVMVNVYLADIGYFAEFNAIYEQYFDAPYPTRTTICCVLRGILVEISAIAEL